MSTPMTLALALLAGAVTWLLCGPDGRWRRARLLTFGGAVEAAGAAPPGRALPGRMPSDQAPSERRELAVDLVRRLLSPFTRRLGGEALCLPVGVLAALLLHSPVPLLAAALAVPLVRRGLRRRAAERAATRSRSAVIGLCSVLAAELRTGRPPNVVLAEAVGDCEWPAGPAARSAAAGVLAAARFGGDVPAALRRMAGVPGAEGLSGVAACWQVGVDSGAGLAGGLDRVAGALRALEQQREELAAQLAGPRSTAALLAVLPVFGVLLGTAMGAGPLNVLLRTPAGLGCLLAGVALECAGLAWTARIVRGAA